MALTPKFYVLAKRAVGPAGTCEEKRIFPRMLYDDHVDFQDFIQYRFQFFIYHDAGEAAIIQWELEQEAFDKYVGPGIVHEESCLSWSINEFFSKIAIQAQKMDSSQGCYYSTKIWESLGISPDQYDTYASNVTYLELKKLQESISHGMQRTDLEEEEAEQIRAETEVT